MKSKITYFTFLAVVSLLLSSCNYKKEKLTDTFSEINITNLEEVGQLKLSQIGEPVTYIPLETNTESLISKIRAIKCFKDKFFINDFDDQIFAYDKKGKLITKISKKGQGPGEYYSVLDYFVDDSLIYILDYGRRLTCFDYNGNFSKYISFPKQGSRVISLDTYKAGIYIPDNQFDIHEELYSWFVFNPSNGDSLTVIKTPKIRNNHGKEELISNHYVLTDFSTLQKNTFKEALNDTLYFLENGANIKSYGFINSGIHKIDFTKTFDQVAYAPHNLRISRLIDSPNFMFLYYQCACRGNTTMHLGVFDKTKRSFFNILNNENEQKIINDFEGPDFVPFTVYNEFLIGYAQPFDCNHIPSFMKNYGINEDDNPIIIIVNIEGEK